MGLCSPLFAVSVMLCQKEFCHLFLSVHKVSSALGRWRQEDRGILSNTVNLRTLGKKLAFMVFNKIIKFI